MRALGLFTYDIRNIDQINGGCLVVSNHPTLIDVVFLLGWIQNASCILKSPLFKNPATMGPVTAAGYLNNDSPDLLEECLNSLAKGDPLLVFPEGTRTRPGQEMRFLRGAANIALASGVEICLVTITVDPVTLVKYQPWWAVPPRTPHYQIEFRERWDISSYVNEDRRSKQARDLTGDLEQYYVDFLSSGGAAASR